METTMLKFNDGKVYHIKDKLYWHPDVTRWQATHRRMAHIRFIKNHKKSKRNNN